MISSRVVALLALLLLWCAVGSQAQPLGLVATQGEAVPATAVIEHPFGDVSSSAMAEPASDLPVVLGASNSVPDQRFTMRAPWGADGPSHASPFLDGPRRPPR